MVAVIQEPCVKAWTSQDDIPGDCQRVILTGDPIQDEVLARWKTCTNDTEYLVTSGILVSGLCAEHAQEFEALRPDWYDSIERLAVIV